MTGGVGMTERVEMTEEAGMTGSTKKVWRQRKGGKLSHRLGGSIG